MWCFEKERAAGAFKATTAAEKIAPYPLLFKADWRVETFLNRCSNLRAAFARSVSTVGNPVPISPSHFAYRRN